MRSLARENAVLLIFEYNFQNNPNEYTKELYQQDSKLTDDDKLFMDSLYNGVIEKYTELSELIQKYSLDYAFNRIYKVDLSILLVASYELKYTDTPIPIIVNEANNLASKYGTDKSPLFVNGILGSIAKETRG